MIVAVAAVTLNAAMIARATHGTIVAGRDQVFSSVSTDTRTIAPGALFIALRGERFDGHAFVTDALRAGATGLLVEHAVTADATVIRVDDSLLGLQSLAQSVRRESLAKVVAITGSAGKTTTKEMVADILAAQYTVFRNKGNLNNHIGLPLSLIELSRGADVAVVELGMNHEGEIRRLVEIAEPDVRVWINVGDAHIGHFGSRSAVARAKAEILEGSTSRTLVVANADDPLVAQHVREFSGRRVMFGESRTADVRARNVVDRGVDGMSAEVATPAGSMRVDIGLPGRALLSNVLAAIGVAVEMNVPLDRVREAVGTFAPVQRRGRTTTLANGARLVDDSYNASPAALMAMIAAMASTSVNGRRIAVLGEMLELGAASRELHADCGRAAAAVVDVLIVVGGPDADGLVEGAREAGFPAGRLHRFATSREAATAAAEVVSRGDLVLVKGSRGTRMEIVSDRLMEVA